MGGFVKATEDLEHAAARILKQLTGLKGVYMEQLQAFGDPGRDTMERTVSVAYFALIDIHKYERQLSSQLSCRMVSIRENSPIDIRPWRNGRES